MEARDALDIVNARLEKRFQAGRPLTAEINGKPRLHILSFDPLVYETYGVFFNTAPRVFGELALRGFLTKDYPKGGMRVYAGMQAEGGPGYGFALSGRNPQHLQVINDVAKEVRVPRLEALPYLLS